MRRVKTELKENFKEGKDCYRRKVDSKMAQNNMKEVWSGMRAITVQQMEGDLHQASKLNLYFNRFDDVVSAPPPPSFSPLQSPSLQRMQEGSSVAYAHVKLQAQIASSQTTTWMSYSAVYCFSAHIQPEPQHDGSSVFQIGKLHSWFLCPKINIQTH